MSEAETLFKGITYQRRILSYTTITQTDTSLTYAFPTKWHQQKPPLNWRQLAPSNPFIYACDPCPCPFLFLFLFLFALLNASHPLPSLPVVGARARTSMASS